MHIWSLASIHTISSELDMDLTRKKFRWKKTVCTLQRSNLLVAENVKLKIDETFIFIHQCQMQFCFGVGGSNN